MVKFSCVAAIGPNGQIGADNNLPWFPKHIKGDMQFFKLCTLSSPCFSSDGSLTSIDPSADMGNVVIMGRRTWDSIPPKFRPLEGRFNIIISSSQVEGLCDQSVQACSFDDALNIADSHLAKSNGHVFIVGGSLVYEAALKHPDCDGVFLTEIEGPMKDGDVFFPMKHVSDSYKSRIDVTEMAFNLISSSCKNISFQNGILTEKDFKYKVIYYSRLNK